MSRVLQIFTSPYTGVLLDIHSSFPYKRHQRGWCILNDHPSIMSHRIIYIIEHNINIHKSNVRMSIPNTTPLSGFWHLWQKCFILQNGFLSIPQVALHDPCVVEVPVSFPLNQILNLTLHNTFIHQPFNFKLTAFIYQKWLLLLNCPVNCLKSRDVENVMYSPLSRQCQPKSYWTYNLYNFEWPRKQSCQLPCPSTQR